MGNRFGQYCNYNHLLSQWVTKFHLLEKLLLLIAESGILRSSCPLCSQLKYLLRFTILKYFYYKFARSKINRSVIQSKYIWVILPYTSSWQGMDVKKFPCRERSSQSAKCQNWFFSFCLSTNEYRTNTKIFFFVICNFYYTVTNLTNFAYEHKILTN